MDIYDAAEKYQKDGTPLIALVGKEYGSGSSRDWAAKGPYLLGIRAIIAESYERIHRQVTSTYYPLTYLTNAQKYRKNVSLLDRSVV